MCVCQWEGGPVSNRVTTTQPHLSPGAVISPSLFFLMMGTTEVLEQPGGRRRWDGENYVLSFLISLEEPLKKNSMILNLQFIPRVYIPVLVGPYLHTSSFLPTHCRFFAIIPEENSWFQYQQNRKIVLGQNSSSDLYVIILGHCHRSC